MKTVEFELIDKEKVSDLVFPSGEVLSDPQQISERNHSLNRALILGNAEKNKFKIIFEDNMGRKAVETTVWGLTDKRIILKHGIVIPIHRVHSVI